MCFVNTTLAAINNSFCLFVCLFVFFKHVDIFFFMCCLPNENIEEILE